MTGNQRLVLLASILGSFVAFLDGSVVNVALPAMQAELGGGIATQQWIVDAYLLTLGSLILLAGSLSDLFGRKRVFAAGLIGFAVTSLACAFAPTAPVLIVARGLQGIAGALLVPSSLAMIVANFSGDGQGKAIGTWTAWTGVSFIAGPLLGGALVDAASWRWIFAINVVPVAATLVILARVAPEPARAGGASVDWLGALTCVLGLGGVIFALIEQPRRGWHAPAIYLPLVGGALACAAFVVWERRARQPMLDFALFRNRNFAAGNAATVAIYAGLGGVDVPDHGVPAAGRGLFGDGGRAGADAADGDDVRAVAGRRAAGGAVGTALVHDRRAAAGRRRAGAAGDGAETPTCAATSRDLLPGVSLLGLGLSTTVAPLTAAVLGGVDERHAGVGSAINNAVARVAGLLAVAAIGAIVATESAHAGRDAKQASVQAFGVAMVSMAALLASGGVVSAIGIRRRRSQDRAAGRRVAGVARRRVSASTCGNTALTPAAAGSWMRSAPNAATKRSSADAMNSSCRLWTGWPSTTSSRGSVSASTPPHGGGDREGEAARHRDGGDVERPPALGRGRHRHHEHGQVVPAPQHAREHRVDEQRPQERRRREQPDQRDGADAERARDQHGPRAQPIDQAAPQRRRQHARRRQADAVQRDQREPHAQVLEHVEGEEAARDADREVPREDVDQQAARRPDRGTGAARRRARRAFARRRAPGSCWRSISTVVTTPPAAAQSCSAGQHRARRAVRPRPVERQPAAAEAVAPAIVHSAVRRPK